VVVHVGALLGGRYPDLQNLIGIEKFGNLADNSVFKDVLNSIRD
jgi:hypothetical protein